MIMGNLKFCKYFSDAKPTVTSPILVFDPVQQRLIWRMSEAALNVPLVKVAVALYVRLLKPLIAVFSAC
jgi:hypothetical protein